MPDWRILLSVLNVLSLSFIASPALAARTETHIETYTTGNTSNTVSVESSSNTKTQTDIVVETNGKKQEYHSDSGEDITITSEDGGTVVKVNNSGSTQSPTSPSSTPKPSTTRQPSHTPVPTSLTPTATPAAEQKDDSEATHESVFAKIFQWLIDLF